MTGDRRYPVQAVHTNFRVIEAVDTLDGAGVTELAQHLDLSKSATYKHVTTLSELGYLTREGDTYHLGVGFLGFGLRARERLPLYRVGDPTTENLADVTGQIASLFVYDEGRGVCLAQYRARDTVAYDLRAGDVVPLHSTAGGKTILAYLPDDTVSDIVGEGLTAVTDKTITDAEALRGELQSARDRRVAFDREEHTVGWQSVASPITDSSNRALGAISVAGPVDELAGKTLEEDVTGLVVSAAKSIENELL